MGREQNERELEAETAEGEAQLEVAVIEYREYAERQEGFNE